MPSLITLTKFVPFDYLLMLLILKQLLWKKQT